MILGITLGTVAAILIGAMIATHLIIKGQFGRGSYPSIPVADYYYDHYKEDYPRRSVTFTSGKNQLQGYIYGEDNDLGLLVFAHGIGTGHEGYMQEILWMVDHGWRVFAYDATGSCTSEGKGTVGLVQSALDLDAALTYIENDPSLSSLSTVLMGHSWGGYAVTAVLNFDHRVMASVSLAGYSEPVEMMMEFARNTMGSATGVLQPFAALENKLLFGEHSALSGVEGINQSGIPVMLVHGTEDKTVPIHTAAIVAHRSEITNPNVIQKILSTEGQNGHNSIFLDQDSLDYVKEVNRRYAELYESHQKNVPNEVRAEFFDSVDRDLINTPNLDLMEEINAFFLKAIQNAK